MTLILAYTPAGTYTNHPTLSEAIADLRQDLFDRTQNLPVGTPQRLADDDLGRALDRALDEYSFVSPLVQAVMTATLPYTRAYAFPPGAWWIESVEYPTGFWPAQLVPFEESITPSLGTPPAASAGGRAWPTWPPLRPPAHCDRGCALTGAAGCARSAARPNRTEVSKWSTQ